ncbi:MAG: ribosome-associated translation inhibitor RaiA [Chloroflexi bacterium]|nr:ribosome-associated translation inhibitor RaiA [Chloroflexota bacterium]
MDILIHSDGLVVKEDLRAAIEGKIGRVEQYAPRALRARVYLRKTSAHPSPRQYSVRVLCEVPGKDVSCEQYGEDVLSAVDIVAEKIERLLRKRKTDRLARRTRTARRK